MRTEKPAPAEMKKNAKGCTCFGRRRGVQPATGALVLYTDVIVKGDSRLLLLRTEPANETGGLSVEGWAQPHTLRGETWSPRLPSLNEKQRAHDRGSVPRTWNAGGRGSLHRPRHPTEICETGCKAQAEPHSPHEEDLQFTRMRWGAGRGTPEMGWECGRKLQAPFRRTIGVWAALL